MLRRRLRTLLTNFGVGGSASVSIARCRLAEVDGVGVAVTLTGRLDWLGSLVARVISFLSILEIDLDPADCTIPP